MRTFSQKGGHGEGDILVGTKEGLGGAAGALGF